MAAADEILGISGQMDISDIEKSIEKLYKLLDTIGDKAANAGDKLDQSLASLDVSKAQQQIQALEKELQSILAVINANTKEIDDFQKRIATAKEAIKSGGNTSELNSQIKEYEEAIKGIQQNSKQLIAEHDQLQGSLTSLVTKYNMVAQAANAGQTASTAIAGASASAHVATAVAVGGEAAAHEQNAQKISDETAKTQESIETKKSLQQELTTLQEGLSEINVALGKYADNTAIEKQERAIARAADSLERFKQGLANGSIDANTFGTQQELNKLQQHYDNAVSKLEQMKQEQEKLKTDQQDYTSAIAQTKQKIDECAISHKNASKAAAEVKDKTKSIGDEAEKTTKKVGGIFSKFKSTLGGAMKGDFSGIFGVIGKIGVWGTSIAALGKGLYELTVRAEEFRAALQPLSHYIDNNRLSDVRQDILALSATTSKSVSDMAQAATQFVKVWDGLQSSSEAITTMIRAANEFGALSGKTSQDAAKYLSNLASEYHLTAQQATTVSNVIATAAHNSTDSFAGMADALHSAGQNVTVYGASFEDMATLVGYSSNQFGGAQKAASKLSMLLMSMEKMQNNQYKPSVVGVVKALQNLKSAIDKGELSEKIFQGRIRQTARYFINNANAIAEYGKHIGSTAAKEELLVDANMRASTNVKKLQNAWDGFLTSINANITPTLTNILGFFTKIIGGAQETAEELRFLQNFDKTTRNSKGAAFYGGMSTVGGFNANTAGTSMSRDNALELYRKQSKELRKYYDIGVRNAQKKYKGISAEAAANAGENMVRSLLKAQGSKYSLFTSEVLGDFFSTRRNETRGLMSKAINTSDDIGANFKPAADHNAEMLAKKQRDYREEQAEQQAKEIANAKKLEWDIYIAEQEKGIAKERDANEKELKQRKLDFEKKKHQIDDEAESLRQENIKAAKANYEKNPENKNKEGFYARGLDKNVTLNGTQIELIRAKRDTLNEEYKKAEYKREKESISALDNYIKEYGSYEAKRLAITKEYEEKIKEAKNVGEKSALQAQLDKSLSDLDFEKFKNSIDWDAVFQNLERYSAKYLEKLRNQLKSLLSSGTLKVDDMRTVSEQINKIDDAISTQKTYWGIANEAVREHKRLLKEVETAQLALDEAQREQVSAALVNTSQKLDIQGNLAAMGINASMSDITVANKDKYISQISDSKKQEKLKKSFDELAIAEVNLAKKTEDVAKAEANLENKRNAAKKTPQEWAQEKATALQGVYDKIKDLPNLMENLDLGDTGVGKSVSHAVDAIGSAKNAFSDFASGNVIGALSNSVSALKSATSVFGIGADNIAKMQQKIDELNQKNSILTQCLSDLNDTIQNSSMFDAAQNFEEQRELTKQQEKNASAAMIAEANKHGTWANSLNYSVEDNKGWKRAMQEVSKILGKEVKSSRDFLSLSAEEMAKIQNYKGPGYEQTGSLLSAIYAEYNKEGGHKGRSDQLPQMIQEYIDTYKDVYKKIDEAENSFNTSISFDSVKEEFKSLLSDMTKSTADFTSNFESMMRDAIINTLMQNTYNDMLKNWYQKFSDAYKDDYKISTNEMEALRKEYEDIVSKATEERDALVSTLGIAQSTQTATTKGISAITADQASTLTGIGYAMQIALEQGNETRTQISIDVSVMRSYAENIAANMSEMRDIQYEGLGQLQQIVKNTAPILVINDNIASMYKLMKDRY